MADDEVRSDSSQDDDEGVGKQKGTAAPEQAGVPETPAAPTAPTAKPKPINLDDDENFRKFKSERDRREAQMQAEIAETRRLLQEQQAREQQRAAAEAAARQREYQQRVEAAPDDYTKLQLQREYEAQYAQMLAQQNQYLQAQLGQVTMAQQIERDKQARIQEMRERMQQRYDVDIPEAILQDAADLPELGAKALKYIEEQIAVKAQKEKAATRQREGVDNVDIGAGAPRSLDAAEKRAWEQATRSNDLEGALGMVFKRAAKS